MQKGVDQKVLKNYRVPNHKENYENNTIIDWTENGKKVSLCSVTSQGQDDPRLKSSIVKRVIRIGALKR